MGKKVVLSIILIFAGLLVLISGTIIVKENYKKFTKNDRASTQGNKEKFYTDGIKGKGGYKVTMDEETEDSDLPEQTGDIAANRPEEEEETTEVAETETTLETKTDFSTKERPDLGDFLWYTEDVHYNGVPKDVKKLHTVESVSQGWKALILYDPNNEFQSNATEFLNITIEGTESNLVLVLDWYHIFWGKDGEYFDETEMEDTEFRGKWENDGLWASGAGTIRLTQFYELNGKQYAVGTMDTPDGIPAFIAMVRP